MFVKNNALETIALFVHLIKCFLIFFRESGFIPSNYVRRQGLESERCV